MDDPFSYRFRVRFCECDPQRVAFNAYYGMYIDLAVLEFMRSLGLGDSLVKGPLDYQVVKQTVEWKGPARFDQVVEVSVWASRLGTTSFVIATEFRIAGDEMLIATGETVYVLVDAATLTKTPLPPEFRKALEQGATGLCVDHANSTPQNRGRNA
jgi:acyl-CoA thioester hydrolase